MRKMFCISICVLFLSMIGCASIVSTATYPIAINSNPSGATVSVTVSDGYEITRITTPGMLYLSASNGFFCPASYTLTFEKEGYNSVCTQLSASLDPWYIGNFLFGGLIGFLIIDPATGAMWSLDTRVYRTLSPVDNRR